MVWDLTWRDYLGNSYIAYHPWRQISTGSGEGSLKELYSSSIHNFDSPSDLEEHSTHEPFMYLAFFVAIDFG